MSKLNSTSIKSILACCAFAGSFTNLPAQLSGEITVSADATPSGLEGSQITFVGKKTGKKEIYLIDFDGKNLRKVTSDGVLNVSPAISPDGKSLAYTGYSSGYPDIYFINTTTGARRRVIAKPGTNSGCSYALDGRKIAFTMSYTGNTELYVMNAAGSGARRLTRSQGTESSPSFGPDGSIVYCSDESGSPQLYVTSARGGTGRKLNAGYGYCTEPSWSPDGTKIAFNCRVGGTMKVAIYNMATRASKVVSGGSAEDPSWGADSKHLIYAQSGRSLVRLNTESGVKKTIYSMSGLSEPSWSK